LPISLVSLILNEITSKRKVHSKEQAKITYNVAKNALINENQTCNLITLDVNLNVTKILDKFSNKITRPQHISLRSCAKETNKQTGARKREEEEGHKQLPG